jgi:hypothetical protein
MIPVCLIIFFISICITAREHVPGIVAVTQTFRDRIILHPYLHLLVTEGEVDEAGRATIRDSVPALSPRRASGEKYTVAN